MKITLVADNPNSWLIPFVKKLQNRLAREHKVYYVTDLYQVRRGDLAFFLGCQKIVPPEILKLNKHNLVIHESDLPKGRGWSPMTWQILEGKNEIIITLFDAKERVDSGLIYLQNRIKFEGHELIEELRQKQGKATTKLVTDFIDGYPKVKGRIQHGEPTYYLRRRPENSELNINQSIKEQFNLFRVVDNRRYPAFFRYRGHEYVLTVSKRKNKT